MLQDTYLGLAEECLERHPVLRHRDVPLFPVLLRPQTGITLHKKHPKCILFEIAGYTNRRDTKTATLNLFFSSAFEGVTTHSSWE